MPNRLSLTLLKRLQLLRLQSQVFHRRTKFGFDFVGMPPFFLQCFVHFEYLLLQTIVLKLYLA